jgi:DNA-binding NtrC family response regulator
MLTTLTNPRQELQAVMKRTCNVLVVEDDRDCAGIIELILIQEGFAVRIVSSRDDALRFLDINLYDVVLMDLYMPGMGPKQFITEVHRRHPRSQVILVTAATIASSAAVEELNLCHWLKKPFQPSDLVDTVRKCLNAASDSQ